MLRPCLWRVDSVRQCMLNIIMSRVHNNMFGRSVETVVSESSERTKLWTVVIIRGKRIVSDPLCEVYSLDY